MLDILSEKFVTGPEIADSTRNFVQQTKFGAVGCATRPILCQELSEM